MLSKNLNNKMQPICSFLEAEFLYVSSNLSTFGYRERIRIERCLFLLIKILCKNELNYDLQGFSKIHIDKLQLLITDKTSDRLFNTLVDKAYQTKIYLKSLSSESGYVRGDALSKLGLNRNNVFAFIKEQLNSIINKANALNTQYFD